MPAASAWDARQGVLRTRFCGVVGIGEVVAWRAGLYTAAAGIPRDTPFKMLVDIRGYSVTDMDPTVHKVQREVIPLFLAGHHFRTGFIDFFGVKGEITASRDNATCLAVAHVHHDCPKMELYRQTLGREEEAFFCQLPEAESWLSGFARNGRPLPEASGRA